MIDNSIANICWAICSTHHTICKTSPSQAIFGWELVFNTEYLSDWSHIGKHRQEQMDKSYARENKSRIYVDYRIGTKVLLIVDGVQHKARNKKMVSM